MQATLTQTTATPTILQVSTPWMISSIDAMDLIYIPGGEYIMGENDYEKVALPEHPVTLNAYWMEKTEVNNHQFALFPNEMGNKIEGDVPWLDTTDENNIIHQNKEGQWEVKDGYQNHLVVDVTWYADDAF